ncbi:hypothetical protein [Thalassomonas haliotis]|nr:hypothetical protein [Thalassomonas haliotis]
MSSLIQISTRQLITAREDSRDNQSQGIQSKRSSLTITQHH